VEEGHKETNYNDKETKGTQQEEYKKYPPKKNNINKGTMSHQLI